jgi:hypothetical protein
MEKPESRPAPSPEAESDDFASPSNPQPSGRDLLAFEPVPLRYRTGGLTPERQRAYVEALADTGVAREAAARVGVSEQAINRVRRRADARSFDNACEAAHMFGARQLRSIAFERAVEGTLKGRYYHGELISEERVHDNRLLIYLLGKTEHLLQPPPEARAICDNWEPYMDALEQGLPAPTAAIAEAPLDQGGGEAGGGGDCDEDDEFTAKEVWQEDDGSWRTSLPPPEGFDGEEVGVWTGFDWYCRMLTPGERAVMEQSRPEEDAAIAEERARAAARRDRFFGFAGDGISSPREAGTNETNEPSEEGGDEAPIEFKSMVPPSSRRKPGPMNTAARRPALRLHGSHIDFATRATSKPPLPGILIDEPPGDFA